MISLFGSVLLSEQVGVRFWLNLGMCISQFSITITHGDKRFFRLRLFGCVVAQDIRCEHMARGACLPHGWVSRREKESGGGGGERKKGGEKS